MKISVILGLALACALPGSALADSHTVSIADPLDQPCYPHTFCTPDLVAATASYDPVAGTATVSVSFNRPVPGQEDPSVPGYEVKVALAGSASNGHCGNILQRDISSGLARGDLLLRGFVAGQVSNPQWAQGDLVIGGGGRRLEVARTLSADGTTLEYGFQSPALVGASFWCFEVSENPVADEIAVADAAQYVTFTGAQPAPNISGVLASHVTPSGASVAATIDPDGAPTTAHVEFGTSASYGSRTVETAATTAVGSISSALSGLEAGTTYHFRIVATSATGTTATTDQTFTTRGGSPLAVVVAGSLAKGTLARCARAASSPAVKLSGFRWLRDGAAIAGATAATYRIGARDAGHMIRCGVAFVDPSRGSLHATSVSRKAPKGST